MSSLCATAAFLLTSRVGPANSDELYRAPKISKVIDGVVFEAGNWEPHLAPGAEEDLLLGTREMGLFSR